MPHATAYAPRPPGHFRAPHAASETGPTPPRRTPTRDSNMLPRFPPRRAAPSRLPSMRTPHIWNDISSHSPASTAPSILYDTLPHWCLCLITNMAKPQRAIYGTPLTPDRARQRRGGRGGAPHLTGTRHGTARHDLDLMQHSQDRERSHDRPWSELCRFRTLTGAMVEVRAGANPPSCATLTSTGVLR